MLVKLIKRAINSPFVAYAIRCVTGFLIGYFLIEKFPQHELFWVLLSIILVISPDEKDARKLTIERSKSNFIGSISGLLVFFLPMDDVYKIALGILIALIICRFADLINVARSAIVGLLIVLMEHKTDTYWAPGERFIFVTLGCFIGLSVTLITSYVFNCLNKNFLTENE
ncbi:FUSC family protein [Pedobacter gandavensis]|uniref:FUSC family protein n=1 Tax=Pedobacter gandavensis TaxID=2679963 RepID=A0ABR6EQ89_9SPHI|nr:FUSC family protein [Pedobacter gandavensis]MBB2147413.1 FUSC family protein [Pedobacter gandavensis]